MKLYEIANDYLALVQAVEDEEIPEEAISDTLEAIEGEIEVKADNIAVASVIPADGPSLGIAPAGT